MKSQYRTLYLAASLIICHASLNAAEYQESVTNIAEAFSNSDPEAQYTARRNLEILVSQATAPNQSRGAAKITEDLLHALASNDVPREAKKYILRQLARVGTSKAVNPLADLMSGSDQLLAEEARKALEIIEGSKARNALIKAYPTLGAKGKKDILKSLAHRGESGSVGFIAKELENGSDDIAATAAWSLGQVGGSRSLRVLSSAYSKGPASKVAAATEQALLANDQVSSDSLYAIYRDGSSVAQRRAALRRLVDRQDRGVAEAIATGLASDDSDLRLIAIESALSSGNGDYQSIVLGKVPEMEYEDLLAVLAGLVHVDAERAERIAIEVFENGDETLQLLAVDVLGRAGSADSVGALLRAFDEGSRAVEIKASLAIARIDTPAMDAWIQAMLDSVVEEDVLRGQELLTHRNVPGGKDRLMRFVKSGNPAQVRGALRTFSIIADTKDLDLLFEISRGSSEETKRLIESLLQRLGPVYGSIALNRKLVNLGIVDSSEG
jgi:hypothetical protein